ncbi:MAG: N-acetylmuramoyl-L-alanine amidase family protein [Intestinibacillus sp.]
MQISIVRVRPQNGCRRKKKRKTPKRRIAAIAFAVAAFGVLAWLLFGQEPEQDANITYIGDIPVISQFLPENSASRPGTRREIKYVVIHETDNFRAGADAAAHNAYLLNNAYTQELSWHYTVDDHEIYHNLPDDEVAYHASDHLKQNGGNRNGIGVELCVNEDGDYEQTLRNAELLTAALLKAYGLSVEDVKKHQDFSGKICPARLIGENRWDEFLDQVRKDYTMLSEQEKNAQEQGTP